MEAATATLVRSSFGTSRASAFVARSALLTANGPDLVRFPTKSFLFIKVPHYCLSFLQWLRHFQIICLSFFCDCICFYLCNLWFFQEWLNSSFPSYCYFSFSLILHSVFGSFQTFCRQKQITNYGGFSSCMIVSVRLFR